MRSDEELVRALWGGDTAAFDELYDRYSRRLFGYMCRFVEPSEAEDLLQEVYVALLRNRQLDLTSGRLGGWLFTVARNRCLSSRRQRARLELTASQPEGACNHDLDEELAHRQRAAVVQRAVDELSEAHRDALLLHALGDLTCREIAAAQGVPEGTVKSRLHYALVAVRRRLGEDAPTAKEARPCD
jgi:RNA polymerase sigma-70 factor, ECF subfamily